MYDELLGKIRQLLDYKGLMPVQAIMVYKELLGEAADAIEELSATVSKMENVRWISVAEMLPEEWGVCLCWYEYYHVSRDAIFPEYGLGVWNNDDKCWCGEVTNGRSAKVLAWMPLPEPYEPPKEET